MTRPVDRRTPVSAGSRLVVVGIVVAALCACSGGSKKSTVPKPPTTQVSADTSSSSSDQSSASTAAPASQDASRATSFGVGMHAIGTQIKPGLYKGAGASGGGSCSWTIHNGAPTGPQAGYSASSGPQILALAVGQDVTIQSCATFTLAVPHPATATSFGDGMYQVDVDIQAGDYLAPTANQYCLWSTHNGSPQAPPAANGAAPGQSPLTLRSGQFVISNSCGTWTKR